MKKSILLSILISAFFITSFAQLSHETIRSIDDIFIEWDVPNHPGGTIGIMHGGELIYCKSFGLANIEFMTANSNSTRYNIASVSKQFTSFGILLLEKEGKLKTSDEIHKYLPELPDFGEEITLEHMIHHTSGLRSLHSMLQLAGWRGDDLRTNEDLMRFMLRQKELNYVPGAEYMYCNTGYILMSEIIERISGQNFADWMKENVFMPMGMRDSYVEDQYNRVVKANASSYSGSANSGFVRSIDYWGYVGSGNIHSTVEDILIWNKNFYNPPEDLKKVFEKMKRREILNNGDTIKYAFGINVDTYKGNKRVSHSGSIGGYRAFAETFPEDELSIAILSNFSSSSVSGKANSTADLVLQSIETFKSETLRANRPERGSFEHSTKDLKSIIGEYWSPELMTTYFISYEDNKLRAYHNRHGYIDFDGIEKDLFEGSASYFNKMKVIRDSKGIVTGIRVTNSRVRNLWFEKR